MRAVDPRDSEWSEAWIEGEEGARWRSAMGLGASTGAKASGCSLLEIPVHGFLPRHTDSAEEIIVVISGRATVTAGDASPQELGTGGLALIPENLPHSVRNTGVETLRFVAVYAAPEVVTRYEGPVQPDGECERQSAG